MNPTIELLLCLGVLVLIPVGVVAAYVTSAAYRMRRWR